MRTATRADYRERIERAMRTIAANLDEPLVLADLADDAGFSPCWFHRVFALTVGETPAEFGRRLRLERAAHRLRASKETVGALAAKAGFADQAAFTRAFAAAYGLAPGAYRRGATPAHLPAPSGAHFDPAGALPRLARAAFDPKTMELETLELAPRRYAALRHVGPYETLPKTFMEACQLAGRGGLWALPGAATLAVYLDDPTQKASEALESDAAVFLPEDHPIPEGMREGRTPGGRFAKSLYKGPYTGLGDAWGSLVGDTVPAAGLVADDRPSFEIYLNNPGDTAPEDLLTELYVPVRA